MFYHVKQDDLYIWNVGKMTSLSVCIVHGSPHFNLALCLFASVLFADLTTVQTHSYGAVHNRVSGFFCSFAKTWKKWGRIPWILAAWPTILGINEVGSYSVKVFSHSGPVECLTFLTAGLMLVIKTFHCSFKRLYKFYYIVGKSHLFKHFVWLNMCEIVRLFLWL